MATIDLKRVVLESIVSKTLRDIRRDPERSLRNLFDMGATIARGRFQHRFMGAAQAMLSNEKSPYYQIARNAVTHISTTALKTFGINLGYNSYTVGAKTIRTLEAEVGVNIPWIINFSLGTASGVDAGAVDTLIQAAKDMGIYAYAFSGPEAALRALSPVLPRHKDCAFFLFFPEGISSPAALDWTVGHPHALTGLSLQAPGFSDAFARLRQQGALCCPSWQYDDENLAQTLDPAWQAALAQHESIFVFLHPAPGASEKTRALVRTQVLRDRQAQRYPFFFLDYEADLLEIDTVISDQPCYMGVDPAGQVYAGSPCVRTAENILQGNIRDIILRVMPPVQPPPAPGH